VDTGHVIQILAMLIWILATLYRYWPYYTDTGHIMQILATLIQILATLIQILAMLYRYWPFYTDTGRVNTETGHRLPVIVIQVKGITSSLY